MALKLPVKLHLLIASVSHTYLIFTVIKIKHIFMLKSLVWPQSKKFSSAKHASWNFKNILAPFCAANAASFYLL